jgi:ribulose 1,5-bisphosphate carboxylase large subunit-like protein
MEVLAHELCHAAVGVDAGHGPEFRAIAHAIGLRGSDALDRAVGCFPSNRAPMDQ